MSAPDGLRSDDPGMRLLAARHLAPDAETLLVCCGAVPGVGPAATRIAIDLRERIGAIHRCVFERSAVGRPPLDSTEMFSQALAWPRPHLGKDFTHLTFARAGLHLREGGRLAVAARTKKGAKTLARDAEGLFGNVRVVSRRGGWRVFECTRHSSTFDAELARQWLEARHAIEDPRVGSLLSAPGVFSRRALDRGTAALIDAAPHLLPEHGSPGRVVDLGAGVGPLSIWAARRWPSARVTGIETNTIAGALFEHNMRAAGVDSRVRLMAADGLPTTAAEAGSVDLVISNPPTHADKATTARMLAGLPALLSERGRALFVVSRPGGLVHALQELGATPVIVDTERFGIVHASFATPAA